ncbi:methyltransferase domain-containing protein (plasmid) [Rhizobium sp. N6212]|nr:methyltransferase domain-containing protein [Rhizobium sp. N731]ANK95056.1 methyltransferase domain-containing protein [Rhizobium sp. N6212]ANL01108.1 methyltransferase domain-containing protein [Rhizobium sp. N621]ANL07231.1 methyltransferase domain-containing protein [Rhizobium esperanzae]ANL13400.1 methyltransferase domain-containing protein [Rhizobium sp. N1341]ANL18084.1 methyltransferase domain-containing protein [Rhizobium sp. N1314]ANL25384.1 methyltransferase domain-containing pro
MRFGEIETAPDHFLGDYPAFKWEGFKHVVPKDLQGRSVLDISCNAGFYSASRFAWENRFTLFLELL